MTLRPGERHAACVSCGINGNDVPATVVHRTAAAFSFVPLAKDRLGPGHVVVAPRVHHADLLDIPSSTLSAVMKLVQTVAQSCGEALGAEGANILHATGAAAGQSVRHLHFHVVPRWAADGIDAWPAGTSSRGPDEGAYEAMASWLRAHG